MKPPYIDDLTAQQGRPDGRWVIAKPVEYYGPWRYIYRAYHALLILVGEASAIRFH